MIVHNGAWAWQNRRAEGGVIARKAGITVKARHDGLEGWERVLIGRENEFAY